MVAISQGDFGADFIPLQVLQMNLGYLFEGNGDACLPPFPFKKNPPILAKICETSLNFLDVEDLNRKIFFERFSFLPFLGFVPLLPNAEQTLPAF